MVACSPTASIAARIRSFRSLSESVGLSPVVPTTTSPSEPWSTRYGASRWKASKSIFPFSWNGVAIAVRTEPSIRGIVCRMRYVLVHGADATPVDVAIACSRDAAVAPDSFAGVVPRVVDFDAGHFPIFTHPRDLADA